MPWASVMLAFNARPPDPAIVGERWRELWHTRLEGNVNLIETWLGHQRRDAYWREGSVCENYAAICCPVLAISGWADAYVDAIFRLLEHLDCPRRAIVGPWGHQWPQAGRPGPAIAFLDEALRWWDHWLKGRDRGIMDEPMLRAYMQDPAPRPSITPSGPAAGSPSRAGRRPQRDALRLALTAEGCARATPARAVLDHRSGATVGLDAGAWCAYGNPADLPPDQRRDDGLSLCFDSEPLERPLELLGAPELALRVACDRPVAHLVGAPVRRLLPTALDARHAHARSTCAIAAAHEPRRRWSPAKRSTCSLGLKSVAYAIRAGHRLRVALSTEYWPWLWPRPSL